MMLPNAPRKVRADVDGERLLAAWAAAEARLEAAAAFLRREEEEALVLGTQPDEDTFDQLICEYCHAQRQVVEAQRAWQQWQAERTINSGQLDASGAAGPTPGLLFARWLYLHGRIAG